MARKLLFSLFFFIFMAILATCSMVKEQSPAFAEDRQAETSAGVDAQQGSSTLFLYQ